MTCLFIFLQFLFFYIWKYIFRFNILLSWVDFFKNFKLKWRNVSLGTGIMMWRCFFRGGSLIAFYPFYLCWHRAKILGWKDRTFSNVEVFCDSSLDKSTSLGGHWPPKAIAIWCSGLPLRQRTLIRIYIFYFRFRFCQICIGFHNPSSWLFFNLSDSFEICCFCPVSLSLELWEATVWCTLEVISEWNFRI